MSDNKPTHKAYAVREFKKDDGKTDASWLEVGAAWAHKDGKGFNVTLEAVPVGGKIVLRTNEPKPAKS